ncbi:MAG: dihydrofolate reductase [Patescibacteria group bacterium]
MISLIAVMGARTRAIGKDNDLLWRLPEELARFKRITLGHPVIMGRKTWESIPEKFRPLPGRTNVVVTRDTSYEAVGAEVAHSLEEALTQAKTQSGSEEIFIIGGAQLYAEALPIADRLYLTLVDDDKEGEAFFPDYGAFMKIVEETPGEENGIRYTFLTLER